MSVPAFTSAKVISYVTFLVYAYTTRGEMGIETVFVALTLVETPRRAVAHFFPLAISTGSEALITIARIQVHVLNGTTIHYLLNYWLGYCCLPTSGPVQF